MMVRWDKNKKFYISSLQGETAKELLAPFHRKDLDSVVLLTSTAVYTESNAAIRILSQLRWFSFPAYTLLLIPRFIRDSLYRFVAKNRYKWFGKNDTCRMPTKEEEDYFLP